MPFLIRAKRRGVMLRDLYADGEPMYSIDFDWTAFELLPPSVPPVGDADLEVREVDAVPDYVRPPRVYVPPAPPVKPAAKVEDTPAAEAARPAKATFAGAAKTAKRKSKKDED